MDFLQRCPGPNYLSRHSDEIGVLPTSCWFPGKAKKFGVVLWSTSQHDVYLMSHYTVLHLSALALEKSEVMDVSGLVALCEKHPGSLLEGLSHTQVSTLAVKDKLLVAGGFQGELICKYLDQEGINFCCRTTYDDNAITNIVDIYNSQSGAVHFMASHNACGIRDFDVKFQLCKHFHFLWPVNHSSLSPDGKLIATVGDNPEGLLVDATTGKTVHDLKGHLDFSFASAWNPDGRTFAAGNQDKTCRIWDTRNLSRSLMVLRGNLCAIRSIHFTSDGQFMLMAEPADFVHIFDIGSGYSKRQELDFFGEISGMQFIPDTEALFVGVWDHTYASLLIQPETDWSGAKKYLTNNTLCLLCGCPVNFEFLNYTIITSKCKGQSTPVTCAVQLSRNLPSC